MLGQLGPDCYDLCQLRILFGYLVHQMRTYFVFGSVIRLFTECFALFGRIAL